MASERRGRLREYIEQQGEASITELSRLCGDCSSMTLWRDLKALEEEGVIRRVHGGAIARRMASLEGEGLYSQRVNKNMAAKRAIAMAARAYISEGRSIYLDAGSTIMALAKLLDDKHYTIVTSGANIAVELSQRASCTAICCGGQVSASTLSCSGPQAEAFIDGVNIDIAIMACSGYTLRGGFTSGSVAEHALKKKVMAKASRVVMLMDAGKLGASLPYTFGALADIDVLVTEAPLPADIAREAAVRKVKVVIA